MQTAWGESQGREMGGKIVSRANLALQAWAGCSSKLWQQLRELWERLSHAHRSSVPSYIGILLVLVTFLYLASQYHLLKPLAFPTRS